MPYLAGFITPQDFGAVGNGTTDDTSAFQQAVNYVQSQGGGTLFLPTPYALTPVSSTSAAVTFNNGTTGYNGIKLLGASAGKSVITKLAAGPLFSFSGPSTDTTGLTHCKYCSLENVSLNGNALTGTMLYTYYADNLYFTNVHFLNNYDVVQDTTEFWDSKYYNCVWETSGSMTTPNAIMPNLRLRNSAAASGFGYSTDNVDNISFANCRWEDFRNGAVRIEQGVAALNNPNSIMFTNCKFESSFLNGGSHFFTDASSRGIFLTNGYFFSGGFETGFSTAQDVITISSAATALKSIWISDRASTPTVANGITLNSTSTSESVVLEDIFGIYNTAPTGAHVNYGTATGSFRVNNVNANTGTIFGGTIPTNYAATQPLLQASGAVADASFSTTPPDGTMGLDKLNNRFYVRDNGGVWNFMPIKTVTTGVSATTTISTTGLQTLQTATVPANDPQTGSVYVVRGYGTYTSTTGTATFALYWGGTAGTLIASIPAFTPTALTNAPFEYEAIVNFRSTTSCTAVFKLFMDTSTSTDTATVYVGTPATATTVTTTSANALAVGFTWTTTAGSISILGGYIEKIR